MEPDKEWCEWCGNPIPHPVKAHKEGKQFFCSDACIRADYRDWKATERDKWSYYNEV